MSQSVKLVLHGIDTVATVYINGEEVGQTDNMFVRYKFEIKSYLKLAGLKNLLMIRFESPIKYAARQSHQSIRNNRGKVIPPYCPSPAQRGECHVNFIRKMQASFSWDWGPAFPSMGIYKNIELEYGSFGIIRDILVETRRLTPLVHQSRPQPQAPPQVIISSTIKHNVRTPIVNKSVPYIRAPPYYIAMRDDPDLTMMEPPERIDITQTNQQLMEENWLLKITLVAEMVQPSFPYNVRVEFNLNGVLHYESEHISVVANPEGFIRLGFNLRIDHTRMQVRPWWPNNAGSQQLYKLIARIMPIPASPPDRITLHSNDQLIAAASNERQMSLQARSKPLQTPAVPPMTFLATSTDSSRLAAQISEKEIWFGFRTIELIQEPITRGNVDDGLTFNFRINGVDIFAMGSNWIPASVLPENSNDLEYIRYLLQSAKDANMNMLRVWGGGIYESDEFYRMADELGIMIWHDFMFACALYPVDDNFLASVRLEIEQQVQRLQYHPSIVLWAGNNENEMAIAGPWWPEVIVWNKKMRENYYKLYTETIRPIVQVLDPTRPYVESSPSNGLMSETQPNTISRHPNDNKYGDVHHYDYLMDSFDWTVYPSTRFASEYGFQSYPSFNALTSISLPSDWKYPLTSNILHRQHRLTGETEMKLQIKVHFNEIKSGGVDKFKSFIYLSQLTQAIAIKTETEFYRRNRFIDPDTKLGKTMGALYWQLNDVWQAPTWSSIEYGGKWKMLHYFARRFFFPIQVMPYIVQPSVASSISNTLQQAISSGSSMLASLANRQPAGSQNSDQQQQSGGFQIDPVLHQQLAQSQQQQSSGGGPQFVVDLVRDDLFGIIDSFNVTIRFYRWTSFTPVWQDTVYVRNTQPQNVTRIYEQDVSRIVRQPGVVSLSSGVFQVLIEQQPRLGLSQIENYLMPVAPNKVTAMRVARISVELIQGPFELTEQGRGGSGRTLKDPHHSESLISQPIWQCAYRLTLVSDSIAMFVWLDLNLINSGPANTGSGNNANGNSNGNQRPTVPQRDPQSESLDGSQQQQSAFERQRPPGGDAPNHVHLEALPPQALFQAGPNAPRPAHMPPEHIRIHMNNQQQRPIAGASREMLETLASETTMEYTGDGAERPSAAMLPASSGESASSREKDHDELAGAPAAEVEHRAKRHVESSSSQSLPPERIVLNLGNDNNDNHPDSQFRASQMNIRSQHSASQQQYRESSQQRHRNQQPPRPAFNVADASGGNMLRYQFSDNAFNMFEPSKVVDLYLSRCLSKAQVEVSLEVQSMADSL
uniref:beta-mannosidase n=1 Tax=Aceria tosichella TaxID=561515 RepID=A0A6G1SGI4_9ACAR